MVTSSPLQTCSGHFAKNCSLLQIFSEQSRDRHRWPRNTGYLNAVFDDRDRHYVRFYVGQSADPSERVSQHKKAVKNGMNDTLLYYIIWKGDGHRHGKFLRLWTLVLPEVHGEAIHAIFNNILEMVMAYAFQSLPPATLRTWFGGQTSYAGVGLNVIPPVYQGISLAPKLRQAFKLQLTESLDPEIKEWPEFRMKQLEDTPLSASKHRILPMLKVSDYRNIFENTIRNHSHLSGLRWSQSTGDVNVSDLLGECAMKLKTVTGTFPELLRPFGSTRASVGMVLGELFYDRDSTRVTSENLTPLPWGILQSGYTESNVLIWTFTFQGSTIDLNSNNATPITPLEREADSQGDTL